MVDNKEKQWKGSSRGGSLGHLFFVFTIKYLGIRAAYGLLCLVVVYFVPFAPKATAAVWYFHRKILKKSVISSAFAILKHYYVFGQTIIDKVAILNGLKDRYKFEFENYSTFLEILNSNTGVVMIGAHVGCWEMGAPFFGEYEAKMNVVMYDAEYQKIKDVLERSVEKNYKIIPVGIDSLDSIIRIKAALNKNEYICFQGDRFLDKSNVLEVNFMGNPALFPLGPYKIASRIKTPVVFYFAIREKGFKYKFHFVVANRADRKAEKSLEVQILTQYIAELEKVAATSPFQWFNFYKFWS